MTDIKLNFVNNSNDTNNSEILIFQKNEAASFEEIAVAWKVIQNCGRGWSHPFVFATETYVAASDSWGNMSPLQPAANGQSFSVVQDPSGDVLKLTGNAEAPNQIDVINGLPSAAISANIYRSGRLLAAKTGMAPGQKAVFSFQPIIWIGAVVQVEEGDVISSAIMCQINTQISLTGVKSADIVMTGGGPGKESTVFVFSLENVTYA
jgi:hypothetical protein